MNFQTLRNLESERYDALDDLEIADKNARRILNDYLAKWQIAINKGWSTTDLKRVGALDGSRVKALITTNKPLAHGSNKTLPATTNKTSTVPLSKLTTPPPTTNSGGSSATTASSSSSNFKK